MVYKVCNNEGFLFSFLGGRFNLQAYLMQIYPPPFRFGHQIDLFKTSLLEVESF